MNSMTKANGAELKGQRISVATNSGHAIILRSVTGVKMSWGTEVGFVFLYGSVYRAMRVEGKNHWTAENRVTVYPAGHPLQVLNPVEFGGTK
jgi:hypothetical protein